MMPFDVKLDPQDAHLLDDHRWTIHQPKASVATHYAVARIDGRNVHLHRLVANAPEGMDVDHINGDGLDNRRENLRVCTRTQNQANRRPNRGRRTKGVSRTRYGTWQAYIYVAGRKQHLGTFPTEAEAAQAYNAAAVEAWGDFARLNEEVAL